MDLYIVTGASRGLGLALAAQLAAREDCRVLSISRAGVPEGTGVWLDLKADLSAVAAQNEAAAAIASALSSQSWDRAVLINNAASLEPLGVLGNADPAKVQTSVSLNLTAPIVLMNAFLVGSARVGSRTVINISSGSGRRPIPGSGTYCATKAGLDMASRVAAAEAEAAGANVTICSLAPGIIDTDMQVSARNASETDLPVVGQFKAFKEQNMLKTPGEVARKIIALERGGKLPAGIGDIREL